ncbi:MAG: DUF3486 family protein [Spirochaetaceae bacterium]|nr:DUF3486 family protein [Spirochaetaceae bacterium]
MSQIRSVDKLPDVLYYKLLDMLKNPSFSLVKIVDIINVEAGEKLISKSSLNRFVRNMKKLTGMQRGREYKSPSIKESLERIAESLKEISSSLEKR